MIEVQIEKLWDWRQIAVYVFDRSANGNEVKLYKSNPNYPHKSASLGQSMGEFVNVPIGEIINTPSFLFPVDMFKAIVETGVKTIPPNTAMQNHLQDTIVVRDRLLTTVEKNMPVHKFTCIIKK
jgi:hypothetical protein